MSTALASPPERQPAYRDAQLNNAFKQLRATAKPYPHVRLALDRVEQRLRFVLRVIALWDTNHAARARDLIRLGCLPAANTHASLIFDPDERTQLLRLCLLGGDTSAAERLAQAAAMDREVL